MWAVQPSMSEGFGHCLVEPASTGTEVITLDAPPMNEFPEFQLLPAKMTGQHHYGNLYVPTSFDIDFEQRHKTLNWWQENDLGFKAKFIDYLERIAQ